MASGKQVEKARRLAEAEALTETQGGAAPIGRLLADMTARGPAEDVVAYGAAELVALAVDAWAALAHRQPGRPRIRVSNPHFEGGGRHRTVTVVDIVNDDMPFLLDSVLGELTDSGLEVDLVLHPVLAVERDAHGHLLRHRGLAGARAASGTTRESLIHIHVGRIVSEAERAALAARLEATLADVRAAVVDWRAMLARLGEAIHSYQTAQPPGPVEETAEAIEFLRWLGDDNFTFLGMREYSIEGTGDEARLVRAERPALGVLRDPARRVLRRGAEVLTSTPEIRDALLAPRPLVITKANLKSRVHRRVHMDYVGVKRFARDGRLTGELRILGLFTSTAYTRSTRSIPYVRRKVDHVVARAGFDPGSHSGKSLLDVLESLPRDELLQVEEATLFDWAMQILALDEHPRVRVLSRDDVFHRFVSVLAFVPRDRYSTEARIRMGELLERAYAGRVAAFLPAFPEGSLARVHFVIGRPDPAAPVPLQEELEATIANAVRSWADGLAQALGAALAPTEALLARDRYARAFSPAYQDHFPPEAAVPDIRSMERLSADRPLVIDFQRRGEESERGIALKLFREELPVPLSERIPVLENMGFRVISERTYRIAPAGGRIVHMHEMMLERADGGPIDEVSLGEELEALFLAVWSGAAENDGFNALLLAARLPWRDIAILRALARYLRQVGIPYSQDYLWTTLVRHAALATALVELFRLRFDPDLAAADRAGAAEAARTGLLAALDTVSSLDEDRILRRFVNLIEACVRTNAYQVEESGEPRRTLAFKLDSHRVDEMPAPKPFREIWVYAPRVEGVHLRFGRVARGGLRWSDRPQDFRTEVLGLVKAQQVKNAVIVPVGAKGGFVPKWLKPGMARDPWMAEGTQAYREFVGTLLTLTDNLVGETVVPPPRVVRHDGDDPYLVVAADKGTATFSDTANAISAEAGFWLGDAFASGGSAGYDHKKMGITARGAFEAVKRHFREMDVDIMDVPFTVIGIGDMSGDVFGNGMLLAPTIRLLAAFDHRDIFIDPTPDLAASFAERRRLFGLPRSSWQDYDRAAISAGGGVYSRSAKAIELSPQAQAALGFPRDRATPSEVMNAILKAPADLLWFGGIGTYVRASEESDAEVGDRANDAIRVTAGVLRAKVIGEGANLGMTQRARIDFAAGGGRCNSDAIDNSAGVNSSDVEVNIKIALASALRAGRLTLPARNALLAEMTEEVAASVLANNYAQTLAISLAEQRGMEDFGYQRRLIQTLEARGLLDRTVEVLPDDAALSQREKTGRALTRPEIGILLAYAKATLKDDLLASAVPDDPSLQSVLFDYFPDPMVEMETPAIAAHRLRREIVTTRLVNAMIDRGGPTLAVRISDQTGAAPAEVALAFAAARSVFALPALDAEIDALDSRVPWEIQRGLYRAAQDLLLGASVWFLRHVSFEQGLDPVGGRFRTAVSALLAELPATLPEELAAPARAEAAALVARGVPDSLAHRIAHLPYEADVPDIVLVAERTGASLAQAARTFFEVAHRFRIRRLEEKTRAVAVVDYFDGLALDRAKGTLAEAHRRIAAGAMANGGIEGWIADRGRVVDRTLATVAEITGSDGLSVSRLAVAAGLLADLAGAG